MLSSYFLLRTSIVWIPFLQRRLLKWILLSCPWIAQDQCRFSLAYFWARPFLCHFFFGFPGFSGCLCFLLMGLELCLLQYVPVMGQLLLNVSPACHPVWFFSLETHTCPALIGGSDFTCGFGPPNTTFCFSQNVQLSLFFAFHALPLSSQVHYPVHGREFGFRNEGCCKYCMLSMLVTCQSYWAPSFFR